MSEFSSEQVMNILGRLAETMESNNQQQRQANTNSSMFRSAAPEWAPFNNPIANMAYGGIAGHITNKMMGMEWQRQAPLLGGMNSFAASYARRSTGPAIGISNQLIDTHIAGMGGRFMGNVLGTLGGVDDKRAFADKLASEAVNSRALRTITLMGMQSAPARAITGGDIVGGTRGMYGATALRGNGQILNLLKQDGTLDYSIGRIHAQRTQETASTMLDRMFKRDGTMGITPNMGFTRGFDTGQILGMHTLMSERGYREGAGRNYRDADAKTRADMMDRQLNALSALRDVTGESDLGALNEIYNTFAGGKANSVNPDAMAKAFEKMSAMAAVFGKEGKAFTETAMNLQQQLVANAGKLLGGSPTALLDAGGNIMGGLGSVQVATRLSRDAHALATVRGDTSARGVRQAGEEIAAANAIWMGSTQGQDAMLIEWLNQKPGQINADDYKAWDSAMKSGDKRAQERAATTLLGRSSFGSAEVARASMGDETFRTQVLAQLGPEAAAQLLDRGLVTMDAEIKERTKADAVNRAGNQLEALVRGSGGSEATLKAAERAKVEAMASAAGVHGDAVRAAYASGGMSSVGQLMTSAAFDEVGGAMRQAGQEAANKELIAELKKPGARDTYEMNAGVAVMRTRGADADTLRKYNAAIAKGGPEGIAEAKRLYADMKRQTSKYSTVVTAEEEKAAADYDARLKVAEDGTSEADRLMTEAGGGVAGMRALFKDTLAGREQADKAEMVANEMVEKGIISKDRNLADERRKSMAQRTADFMGGEGDILGLLGIYAPEDISHDDLMKLSPEARQAWYDQDIAYQNAQAQFGNVTAGELATMGLGKIKEKFGDWAGDAEKLRGQVNETGAGIDGFTRLDAMLTDDQISSVGLKNKDGSTMIDGSTTIDTFLGRTKGHDPDSDIGKLRKQVSEQMAATADQEKDGKGGGTGETTATVSGTAQLIDKNDQTLGELVMDGLTFVFGNAMVA